MALAGRSARDTLLVGIQLLYMHRGKPKALQLLLSFQEVERGTSRQDKGQAVTPTQEPRRGHPLLDSALAARLSLYFPPLLWAARVHR